MITATQYVCAFCEKELIKERIDGRTVYGPWADMCSTCHRTHGCGFGTGRGQRFDIATGKKLEG